MTMVMIIIVANYRNSNCHLLNTYYVPNTTLSYRFIVLVNLYNNLGGNYS